MRRLGPYVVAESLARGSQGEALLGALPGYGRPLVIKVLDSRIEEESDDGRARARFAREVKLSSQLSHRCLVQMVDGDLESDPPYLVTNFIAGMPWSYWLHDPGLRRVPPAVALCMLGDLCAVLEYLHTAVDTEQGQLLLAHRDVSPQNLILGFDGVTRLIDLGLAKTPSSSRVTKLGHAMGTLRYMAPEVANASLNLVGPTADIYSASAIAYELLSGVAFRPVHLSAAAMLERAQRGIAEPPAGLDMRDGLWPTILAGLSVRTAGRVRTARAIADRVAVAGRVATYAEVAEWVQGSCPEEVAKQEARASSARALGLSLPPESAAHEHHATRVVARASLSPSSARLSPVHTAVVRVRGPGVDAADVVPEASITDVETSSELARDPADGWAPTAEAGSGWAALVAGEQMSEDSVALMLAARKRAYFDEADAGVVGLPVGLSPSAPTAGARSADQPHAQPDGPARTTLRRTLVIGGLVAVWTGLTVGVTVWAVRDEVPPAVGAEPRAGDTVVGESPRPAATPKVSPQASSAPIAGASGGSGPSEPAVVGSTAAPAATSRPTSTAKPRVRTGSSPSPAPSQPEATPVHVGRAPVRDLSALAADAASDTEARREFLRRARAAMDALPTERRAPVEDAYDRATLRGADRAVYTALAQALLDADRP